MMNHQLLSIFQRRSVRRYQDRPVSDQMVRDLLEAAMAAPSACATDPWEFIVVRERLALQQIAAALPNGGFLSGAGMGLVVCGDLQRAHTGELSYLLQDCSAAIQNVLLAASSLGLGGCWLGIHPRPERMDFLRKFFSLTESIVPVAVLALGWPADKPEPRTRYNPRYVHYEQW